MLLHYLCVIALLPLQHQVVPSNQCKRCQNFNTGIFDKTFEEKYETVDYVMYNCLLFKYTFIGPESDHWLCLSLTDSLTPVYDVAPACEDGNSRVVDVVTVADEDRVVNNLLQISKLRFGKNDKLLFRL